MTMLCSTVIQSSSYNWASTWTTDGVCLLPFIIHRLWSETLTSPDVSIGFMSEYAFKPEPHQNVLLRTAPELVHRRTTECERTPFLEKNAPGFLWFSSQINTQTSSINPECVRHRRDGQTARTFKRSKIQLQPRVGKTDRLHTKHEHPENNSTKNKVENEVSLCKNEIKGRRIRSEGQGQMSREMGCLSRLWCKSLKKKQNYYFYIKKWCNDPLIWKEHLDVKNKWQDKI